MQELKNGAEQWIAARIREQWPRERRAKELAENIDAILREYEVPLENLMTVFDLLPQDEPLYLDDIRGWARRYAEARERVLEGQ